MLQRKFIRILVMLCTVSFAIPTFPQTVETGEPGVIPEGHGRVFIYRYHDKGGLVRPTVRLNGEPLHRAVPDEYFWLDLLPGKYEIAAARRTDRVAEFALLPGEERFVRIQINPTRTNFLFESVLMGPYQALRELRNLEITGFIGIGSKKHLVAIIGDETSALAVGRRFVESGHRVTLALEKEPSAETAAFAEKWANYVSLMTTRDAAESGDLLVLVGQWSEIRDHVEHLAKLDRKVVVDSSVPWHAGNDGYPKHAASESPAELIQAWHPSAFVVKALIPASVSTIGNDDRDRAILSAPIASDHRYPKEAIAQMALGLGLNPVDFGPLRMARNIDALLVLQALPAMRQNQERWGIVLRRETQLACQWSSDDYEAVYDATELARSPMVLSENQGGCK